MNHFFIITNRDKDMDLSTTNEIKHFLQKKGRFPEHSRRRRLPAR